MIAECDSEVIRPRIAYDPDRDPHLIEMIATLVETVAEMSNASVDETLDAVREELA